MLLQMALLHSFLWLSNIPLTSQVVQVVKNPPANAGDADSKKKKKKGDKGSIPGSGISPGEGNGNPLQYFLPGKFHGQRSLAGYSPGSCKDLDPIERQSTYYFKSSLKYVDTFVQ